MLRTKRYVGVEVLASLGSLLVRHIRLRALNRLLYESRLAPHHLNMYELGPPNGCETESYGLDYFISSGQESHFASDVVSEKLSSVFSFSKPVTA